MRKDDFNMKKMFTREYSNYLYKSSDEEVWLKRPTPEQFNKLKDIVKELSVEDEEKGIVLDQLKSIECIYDIYIMLSSQADEVRLMSVDEFATSMSKVVYELRIPQARALYKAVVELLKDVSEEIYEDIMAKLKEIENANKILEMAISENESLNKSKDLINKAMEISKEEKEKKNKELMADEG